MATQTKYYNTAFSASYLEIKVIETTNDVANTSTIDWSVYVSGDPTYDRSNGNFLTVIINGRTECYKNPGRVAYNVVLASGSFTYNHATDGTGSFQVYANYTNSYAGYDVTVNQTHACLRIPRVSSFTVSNGTLGTAQTISITRYNSSFKHVIQCVVGGTTYNIASNVDTSYSWTPAISYASANTTGSSVSATVKVSTYNGSTFIGTASKTISLTIPNSVVGTASGLSYSDVGQSGVNVIVSGYSSVTLQCTVSTANAQGATITGAKFKVGSTTYTATVTRSGTTWTCKYTTAIPIRSSGNIAYSLTATDSRGRTCSASGTIVSYAYSKPTISFTLNRTNSSGTTSDDAYARVKLTLNITSLNSQNSFTCTVQVYRGVDESKTLVQTHTYTTTPVDEVYSSIDTENPYTFVVTLVDRVDQASTTKILSSVFVLVDYYRSGKGVAFGQVATRDNTFESNLVSRFNQEIDSSNVIPRTTNAYTLGNSSHLWSAIYCNSSTINTSDREEKHDIEDLNLSLWTQFLMGLKPISYILNHGESGRRHHGMIAQDVEDLMDQLNISDMDFAGFVRFQKELLIETVTVDEWGNRTVVETTAPLYSNGEPVYGYGLRYEEFIPMLILVFQNQQRRMNDFAERLARIEAKE